MTAMTLSRSSYREARPRVLDRLIIRAGLVLLLWGHRRATRQTRPDFTQQLTHVEATHDQMLRRSGPWLR